MLALNASVKEKYPDSEFAIVPVAHFSEEYLSKLPKEVRILGCTPDYNAYNGDMPNPPPDGDKPMRTASGHIHIGIPDKFLDAWGGKDGAWLNPFVRHLDYALYVPSLLWDKDEERRQMYGQ